VLLLVTGMAYTLWWAPVVRHHDYWVVPVDIWGAYRSAHMIGWGALGNVYGAGTGIITFPGILLLLTPLALITGALGMSESFPVSLAHPSAWLVLGPYEIVISSSALFACDALAERLGVPRGRRAALCVAEGAILFNVSVYWGHPEDALALALALYALVFAFDGRWMGAGWLFGAAVATQPLVLLMLPVMLALAGRSRAAGLLARTILPAVALLAAPLAAEFHATAHALVDQPNYPRIDHVTPWTSLAPRLGGSGTKVAVAAGPGRILAMVLAGVIGWRARRWRDRPDAVLWAMASVLALRCVTESVMVAYYAWPALAVGLVLSAHLGRSRLLSCSAVAVGVSACSDARLGAWPWWGIVSGGLVLVLFLGIAPRASRVREVVPIPLDTAGVEAVHEAPPVLVGARQ